jgi:NAD(P)-dependent dehydrogenase (short-subunit alcohol dehydrogenase family)
MTHPPGHRWLIVGASRGIGRELARQALAAGDAVTGTARRTEDLQALQALGAMALPLDVADAASASTLGWRIDGAGYARVVINAGVYGPRHTGLVPPSDTEFDAVLHTNVLGAMRVLAELVPPGVLAPGAVVAVISSRMGSIGERQSASGWLYRASKAALNSVLKDASLVLGDRAVCVALHPGWVRTDMGGAGADLSVERSAADLRRVLAGLGPEDNGRFLNHDGSAIAW